ncbi:MAG TPA: ABC transporter substrate-binding protein [Usitatibacter sp.]|nr:ABC transporter substrate-binding protein [Usitatibacter sp.]
MKTPLAVAASLLITSCAMHTPSTPAVTDSLRKEFAPSGTLVAGVNFGNPVIAQRPKDGGDPQGVGPSLARELAKRLGVPIRYVVYDTAGKMADAAKEGAWDVAMLAVDPARAETIAFSAPYVLIEGTYLVREDSPLRRIDEFDRKGLTIAVANKSAYDLWLTRNIKQAEIVRLATSQAAIDAFLAGKTQVAAGVKQPLVATAARNPGVRVIEGSFMSIGQASGVPVARRNAAAYLKAFIEEMKATGFVARALAASGVPDATVAPPARQP